MTANQEFNINVLLLVEDSEDDIIITQRKIYRSILKIHKFLVARSLTEAKQIISSNTIDVVLLDLNLPESRGVDSLIEFRKIYDGIVIVVTSLDDELIGIEAIKQGADDYLVKNDITEHTLARAILYVKQRRKLRYHVASMQEKINRLNELGGNE